jgi:hypothetical protein
VRAQKALNGNFGTMHILFKDASPPVITQLTSLLAWSNDKTNRQGLQ